MQPLDIITVPRKSLMTLQTESDDSIVSYVVFLKRFTDSGGATTAIWNQNDVERTGVETTLDDAHGFHIIISATTRPGSTPRMRADLRIGKYRFDNAFHVPVNDNVGWSVIMKESLRPPR
jgi:hypothetical protein